MMNAIQHAAFRLRTASLRLAFAVLCAGAPLAAGAQAPAQAPAAASAQTPAQAGQVAQMLDLAAQNPRSALVLAKGMLAKAMKSEQPVDQMVALAVLADASARLEEPTPLLAYAERGLNLAQRMDDRRAQARFLSAQAVAIDMQGNPRASRALHREALRLADGQRDPAIQAEVYLAYSSAALAQGSISEALDYALRAVVLNQQIGTPYRVSAALLAVGKLHERMGDSDKAWRYSEEAQAVMPAGRYPYQESVVAYSLGVIHLGQRKWDLARQQFERALELAAQLNDGQGSAHAHYRLALVANERGYYPQAEEHARTAITYFENAGLKRMHLMSMLALVNAQTQQKNRQALAGMEAARELIGSLDDDAQIAFYEQTSQTRSVFGDARGAYQDLWYAHSRSKEVFRSLNDRSLHEQMARFDAQRKETENDLLRKEQSLQQAQLAQAATESERLVLLLLVAVLATIIVAYALLVQLKHRRRLNTLAHNDELTGVPNRRSVMAYAAEQMAKAVERQHTVCLAVADLDHFKRINDTYGHAVGDRVLKAFAQLAQPVLRGDDRLGRLGGEEWLFVLPRLSRKRVPTVFARLQAAMRDLRVEGLPPEHKVTFSMGVIVATGLRQNLGELLNLADEALYRAKHDGRNCLRMATEDGVPAMPRPLAGKHSGRQIAVAAVAHDEDDRRAFRARSHAQGNR
jgi:diguanylate cyclase (GGDEF)-like protein